MARKTVLVCDLRARQSTRKTRQRSRFATRTPGAARSFWTCADEVADLAAEGQAKHGAARPASRRARSQSSPQATAPLFAHFPGSAAGRVRRTVGAQDYYGPMALTLLAGPANAGKVALLLDRYLADLDREPVLIVPTGSDVERVERDLLGRCGALLGGSIGTFDDVFEPDRRRERRCRAGRRRRAARARPPPGRRRRDGSTSSARSARFAGFADALGTAIAELEAGLLDPDELDGDLAELYRRYRAELDRLGLWDRDLRRATPPTGSPAISAPGTAGRSTPTGSRT